MNYDGNTLTTSPSLVVGDIINYGYSGAAKSIMLPPGVYKLQCWGAQGGYRSSSSYGGKGGYAEGELSILNDTLIYVYVGGSGNTGKTQGGFNGGGKRSSYNGGGGASDIRIGTDSLYARVIVAGGGGSDGSSSNGGGYGGGTSGYMPSGGYGTCYGAGTQTGNSSSSSYVTQKQSANTSSTSDCYMGFGFGGNGVYYASGYGGAGGGGWYGGGGTYPDGSGDDDKAGAGGSGYVFTSQSKANYPSGCLLNDTHFLANASLKGGNESFAASTGSGTETGHSGDGYVRLSKIKDIVCFESRGGTAVPSVLIPSGGVVISPIPQPTRRNSVFDGWYTSENFTTKFDFSTRITTGLTLYAKWLPVKGALTVLINYNNGRPPLEEYVMPNETISEPPTPFRKGFLFKGWYSGHTPYIFSTPIVSNLNLSAVWKYTEGIASSTVYVKVDGIYRKVSFIHYKQGDNWQSGHSGGSN